MEASIGVGVASLLIAAVGIVRQSSSAVNEGLDHPEVLPGAAVATPLISPFATLGVQPAAV